MSHPNENEEVEVLDENEMDQEGNNYFVQLDI